jgi:serine/threonine-protein kinase
VLHRDLKPANITLQPDGAVKVLDFGLAKALDEGGATPAHTELTAAAPFGVLGTAPYMSPEQVRGEAVDERADIWAFGCIVFEMCTGRRAFGGDSVADIFARVIEREPAYGLLPPDTPAPIRRLIRHSLEKDAGRRLADIRDALLDLDDAVNEPAEVVGERTSGSWWRVAAAAGVAAALTGWSTFILTRPAPAPPPPETRLTVQLPDGDRAVLSFQPMVAVSPDGRTLVYRAQRDGAIHLFRRSLSDLQPAPIPGTENGTSPFFSPDGQWLGFFAGQKLKKVAVGGGVVTTLGDAPDPEGASWSSLGTIAFAPSTVSGLRRVPDGGGTPEPLTRLEKGVATHRWPAFLPGGEALLFNYGTTSGNFENQQVAVQPVATGERRNVVQHGMSPTFAPSGHLLYAQRGSLMAAPFDPRRLAVTGTAVPVVEGVLQASTGASQYSISASGSLVYVPGGVDSAQLRLVWVTRNGVEQAVAAPARGFAYPRLSPDGRRLAVGVADPGTQLWVYEFARETLARLTLEGDLSALPAWTPDGTRIAFTSKSDGPLNIFWRLTDGSGGPERLTTSEYNHTPMSWSPDGQLLAFGEVNPDTGFDILVLRMGDRTAQPFLRSPFNESTPRFSPDARWLAYASDESGRQEIYVQPYPGPGGKWPISAEGGREPVWSRDGRELFYRSGDKVMAVAITTAPGFVAGKPRVLFAGPYEPTVFTVANYDVSPDGQRFLMLRRSEQAAAAPTQINVVLNWFEELRRRVPPAAR